MKALPSLLLAGFFALAGPLYSQTPLDGFWKNWTADCLARLDQMSDSGLLRVDQASVIKDYFTEQGYGVDLFEHYGQLNERDLHLKIHDIADLMRERLAGVLTPEQLAAWKEGEHLFLTRRRIQRHFPPQSEAQKSPPNSQKP